MTDHPVSFQTLSSQLNLDAHQPAPEELKLFFKRYASAAAPGVDDLLDFKDLQLPGLESISSQQKHQAVSVFEGTTKEGFCILDGKEISARKEAFPLTSVAAHMATEPGGAYAFVQIPGLVYLPQLLRPSVQIELLARLLHRDLANQNHKTNLNAHYEMRYSNDFQSIFESYPDDMIYPKESTLHKPLSMRKVLDEKLRWMTLGGQYDWTNKVYPTELPPKFPIDIASLIHHLFPEMEPQAAIVNLYSPRDRLNMHRDVSEEVDKGLVSISIGCSCIFIIGVENEMTHEVQKLALRLRSGDVLYMTGESRLSWHGVAKIEKSTCPEFLKEWPGRRFPNWLNWMQNKRINLNVRQMREAEMTEDEYISIHPEEPRPLTLKRTLGLGRRKRRNERHVYDPIALGEEEDFSDYDDEGEEMEIEMETGSSDGTSP